MPLSKIVNIDEFGELTPDLKKHVDGGSYDEITVKWNKEAWSHYYLNPRCLVDVSNIDTSTTLLGEKVELPFGIAPMGHMGLVHPDGELEMARGAKDVVFVPATVSTFPMEWIAKESAGPKWFQLYFLQDKGKTQELVQRAEASGYKAIVATVDSPVVGYRGQKNIPPQTFGNFQLAAMEGEEVRAFVKTLLSPSITWKDIEWLQTITTLPIVLKGIMNEDDAKIGSDLDCAIWLSNHGGRQLDRTPPAIDLLLDSRDRVNTEIYIDGGVRRGTDIITALAWGADAVFIGRPALYALAYKGAEGVQEMIDILKAELRNAMALLGTSRISDITKDHVGIYAKN